MRGSRRAARGTQRAKPTRMTVTGLVLTLSAEAFSRGRALDALRAERRVKCGEPHGLRLPVVAETGSLSEGEDLFERLRSTEGVDFVDVVSVHFEES